MEKKVLVVSGHTDLNDSVANKEIMAELGRLIPAAKFDYLDRLYGKDFHIDVKAEQQKLEEADIIVLQFPVFWYSMPSLMSRWMEETFQHGWSHGSTGDKLAGKKLIASLTSGAPEKMYHRDAEMGFETEDFLAPLKATCGLTRMDFAGFIYTGGVSYQTRTNPEAVANMKVRAKGHAAKVAALAEKL